MKMPTESLEDLLELTSGDAKPGRETGILGESKIKIPGEIVKSFAKLIKRFPKFLEGVLERGDKEVIFFNNLVFKKVTDKIPPVDT